LGGLDTPYTASSMAAVRTVARRLLPFAALLLALVVAPASAQAASLAGSRVSASTFAASLRTGPPSALVADRQPENAATYDEQAVGVPVATEATGTTLSLGYKAGWSAEQIAAADAKVAALDQAAQSGQLSVTAVERGGTSAASMWRAAGGEIPSAADIDHVIDLQLGGSDALSNLSPLDASVNRSLGAQIACQIRGLAVGTSIVGVSIC